MGIGEPVARMQPDQGSSNDTPLQMGGIRGFAGVCLNPPDYAAGAQKVISVVVWAAHQAMVLRRFLTLSMMGTQALPILPPGFSVVGCGKAKRAHQTWLSFR